MAARPDRSVRGLVLRTGFQDQSIVSFNLNPIILGAKGSDIARRRYGEYGNLLQSDAKDLLAKCNNLLIAGQRILKREGYLIPAFFIEGEGLWLPVMYQPRDRADKHAIVREVADAVLLHRADLVSCIQEAWITTPNPKKPSVHAVDDPARREGILVACLSRTGETTSLRCKFTRTHSGIEFGEIQNIGTVVANFLEPVRRALRKIRYVFGAWLLTRRDFCGLASL